MNPFVCEYSCSQGAFHVETLSEAIEENYRGIIDGDASDFLIFATASTYEEACATCKLFSASVGRR